MYSFAARLFVVHAIQTAVDDAKSLAILQRVFFFVLEFVFSLLFPPPERAILIVVVVV